MKKLFQKLFCAPPREEKPAEPETAAENPPKADPFSEQMAAIALAVRMFQEEVHIVESTVITINRASRLYSPWNSKIHGIPPMPNRK